MDGLTQAQGPESVWDRLARYYGLAGPDLFSVFAHRLVEVVPLEPNAVVLDLACGAGALVSALTSAALQARLVAVDGSVAMLRRAQKVPVHGARYAVAAMDAQLLAFADRTFSTVLCGSALDSFADPARALSEVHRVLYPGGSFGLWVAPSWWWQGDPRWDWHDDLLASLGVTTGQVPAGLDGPASLSQMAQSAGFEHVIVRVDQLGLCFKDAEEWWQWAWSHGFRQVLERLPADQLGVYRQAAFDHIERSGIEGRIQALIATGDRPRDG
jgi:SAM-dependent methyltransferase